MTKKKVFGFDYDGTIINIEPQKARAFGDTLNKHWGINSDKASEFWIETGGTSRRFKFDYFYKQKFRQNLSDNEYKTVESEFSSLLRTKYYPRIKLLPHALETLKFVRKNFNYVFVSSGVPMEEIHYLVDLNGVSDYFNLVLGTNQEYKSKHDHFRYVISLTHPQTLIYLADGLEDMKVTKEFDAISIGLPTNHSRENLQRAGARYICELSKVVKLLQKIS